MNQELWPLDRSDPSVPALGGYWHFFGLQETEPLVLALLVPSVTLSVKG
jgi:hypothetical protein